METFLLPYYHDFSFMPTDFLKAAPVFEWAINHRPASSSSSSSGADPSDRRCPKRYQKPERRVKTGCKTCKERHVKCDEGKPTCARCRDLGKVCKGYATNTRRPPRSTIPRSTLNPPLFTSFSQLTEKDRKSRSLSYYHTRTAPQLSGNFSPTFWSHKILELAQAQPAIQCALSALSAFHEATELLTLFPTRMADARDRRQYALQQYSSAMDLLQGYIAGPSKTTISIQDTLTACVLFILIESLLGDYNAVLAHLGSGLDIICDWRLQAQAKGSPGCLTDAETTDDDALISAHLIPLFTSLDLQAATMLSVRTPKLALTAPAAPGGHPAHLPPAFQTLEESRDSLFTELCHMVAFLRTVESDNSRSENVDAIVHTQATMEMRKSQRDDRLKGLEEWNTRMQALVGILGSRSDSQAGEVTNLRCAVQLKSYYKLAVIMLGVCLEEPSSRSTRLGLSGPSCNAFNAYVSEFSSIVALAESLDGLSNERVDGSATKKCYSFSFDFGILPPLYYTVTHCPDKDVRERAMRILDGDVIRREGVCDGGAIKVIARRIMDLEARANPGETVSALSPVSFTKVKVHLCAGRSEGLLECYEEDCSDGEEEANIFQEWITW